MSTTATFAELTDYKFHTKMFLRNEATGNPLGVILSYKDADGRIHIGWSACHPNDRFNLKLANRIAMSRAEKAIANQFETLVLKAPDAYVEVFELFVERCEKYYAGHRLNVKVVCGYANGERKFHFA